MTDCNRCFLSGCTSAGTLHTRVIRQSMLPSYIRCSSSQYFGIINGLSYSTFVLCTPGSFTMPTIDTHDSGSMPVGFIMQCHALGGRQYLLCMPVHYSRDHWLESRAPPPPQHSSSTALLSLSPDRLRTLSNHATTFGRSTKQPHSGQQPALPPCCRIRRRNGGHRCRDGARLRPPPRRRRAQQHCRPQPRSSSGGHRVLAEASGQRPTI